MKNEKVAEGRIIGLAGPCLTKKGIILTNFFKNFEKKNFAQDQ